MFISSKTYPQDLNLYYIYQRKYSSQLLGVCYNNRARDYKCLLIFLLPAYNNVSKKHAVSNILSTKFEGYRHATYQQIVVHIRDLFTRMDCDTYLSVKPQLLKKTVDFGNRQEVENHLVKLFNVHILK